MYTKLIFFFILYTIVTVSTLKAQSNNDKELIVSTIEQLFDGMRQQDTSMIRAVMAPEMQMRTVRQHNGNTELSGTTPHQFLQAVANAGRIVWDERIGSYEVKVDDALASVWTTYRFYRGDQFSHCGVNVFQLYKTGNDWQIFSVVDTRRSSPCPD